MDRDGRTCAHLLLWELRNYNSLSNRQQENVGSHQKETPHVQGQRRNPRKMVVGGEISFRITPYTRQRCLEGSNKLCGTGTQRPHRDWTRTVFVCLLWRYGSAGTCRRGGGSGWHKPFWRRSPLTPPKSSQNLALQDLVKFHSLVGRGQPRLSRAPLCRHLGAEHRTPQKNFW